MRISAALLLLLNTVTCTGVQTAPSLTHGALAPKKTCTLTASADGTDDTPAVLKVFSDCGTDGHIIFPKGVYHINSIMNTQTLKNVDIDLYGTLLVSSSSLSSQA